jgi:hypothetical protein
MTSKPDHVNDAINAYIDYLDGNSEGQTPSLEHLTHDERREVEAVIENLQGGRRFDPTNSAPSVESLLYGTPYYDALVGNRAGASDLASVRACVGELRPWAVDVQIEGLAAYGPSFVLVINGQPMRAQIRRDARNPAGLRSNDLIATASAVYRDHPETVGVALVYPDNHLSSVVIDPFDPEVCIEVPSGEVLGPRSRRPVRPLADAIRGYMNEAFPIFPSIQPAPRAALREDLDPALVQRIARQHMAAVVESGLRARTEAKKVAWGGLAALDVDAVKDLVLAAYRGDVDAVSLKAWLEELAVTRA